ncbi:MAG: hypothetical protein ACR2O4_07360 [Hyphomicrobiaceae bacterium]
MSKTATPTLDEAVAAAKQLPEAEQAGIAVELDILVREASTLPPRSAEDQRIILERLAEPFVEAPREEVEKLHNRYRT